MKDNVATPPRLYLYDMVRNSRIAINIYWNNLILPVPVSRQFIICHNNGNNVTLMSI